jgi:hypothetical protein
MRLQSYYCVKMHAALRYDDRSKMPTSYILVCEHTDLRVLFSLDRYQMDRLTWAELVEDLGVQMYTHYFGKMLVYLGIIHVYNTIHK